MKRLALLVVILLATLAMSFWVFKGPINAGLVLLGFDRPKEYLVLFQNNMELRSSGGFMGSYGRVRVERGHLELLKIEDIYIPDGQLDGHVDPPWPIQAAFGQGWFKLRDSNWDPDFPTAAKTIEWFFEHGKEAKADGVVAVNLSLLAELLKLTGPVYLVDEPEKISVDNFYKLTQRAVEEDFFPGSSQKRDFLGKLGRAAMERIAVFGLADKLRLVTVVHFLLRDKQILVYSHDREAASWLRRMNFDGSLTDIRGTRRDYLSIFENNLGANKANCCIKREATLARKRTGKTIVHDLVIKYENTNPATLKRPPQYWGGAYVNYLRIGLRVDAVVKSIKVGELLLPLPSTDLEGHFDDLMRSASDEELRKFVTGDGLDYVRMENDKRHELGIQFVGFFVYIDALDAKTVQVQYETTGSGEMVIDRQSGASFPLEVKPLE